MTNTDALNKRIADSGLKRNFIADQLGISRYAFYLKTNGKNDFTTSEVKALCNVLGITRLTEKEAIFFADKVE